MKQRGFTLVELLIVIGIIIILSGILLPVLIGAGKKADQTKAKAEITTLVNAIKQFESTYGVLPVPTDWKSGNTKDNEKLDEDAFRWLIKVLQAQDLTATEESNYGALKVVNSRKQKFLDVVGNDPGAYLDPWDEPYIVFLDSDYDGIIRRKTANDADEEFIEGVSGLPKKNFPGVGNRDYVNFSIVVWSAGPDTQFAYPPSDKSNRDNVYSFSTSWSKASGHSIDR